MDIQVQYGVLNQTIMKIFLHQVEMIKQLNCGTNKINVCFHRQQVILKGFQDQVLMNNKIDQYLVDMINRYQQLNNQNEINNGMQYKRLNFKTNSVLDYALLIIIHSYYILGEKKSFWQIIFKYKRYSIKIQSGSDWTQYPQQYIKSKCIIVNKNASNVNLIRKQQNYEFIIEQSIQYKKNKIFGCMNDDGQYLITWDKQSKEYQEL
ncbi:unnamed protein product [Paramecium primaurelia]|uniref:Uncharacterized protein n=1 Tax=Paramecium primaurelia TaxID=5886 RepID=A0A8S1QMJ1_PARPR|nr:unnamed protein product [Paramecium primaurelia]